MMRARHGQWWLLALLVSGCGGPAGGGRTSMQSYPVQGRYEFVANPVGYQLIGKLRILSDTILVEASVESCLPVMGPADVRSIRYTCQGSGKYEGFSLMFDRQNPVQWSKWSASKKVQKQRRVCAQYTVNAQGQQVCARYAMETYEETERSNGVLRVTPVR